ncbi:MAG: DNA alkylation repair protein [Chlamydiae bacterium CG10_big_fil_rev_8_21_14_0_10_42_34]|nr:MAG: DNA alkylation repair protein [Chlamydiae bacterium CG10_big_fil_rev_8_21_14_0_10_42_34]
MDPNQTIITDLSSKLAPLKDPEFAIWQTNYLRNQFLFLGVKSPLLRKILQKIKKENAFTNWREEVQQLITQPAREFHHAAYIWAILHRNSRIESDLSLYTQLIQTHSWWDTVDPIATQLIGPFFEQFPKLVDVTQQWIHSPNLWMRRTAIIYPIYNKKEIIQESLFHNCKQLRLDKDFFIRKAIGWALREYAKIQPDAVLKFLTTAELSPLSVREAKRHLRTSQ